MSRLDRTCSVLGCSSPVWSREMCRKHYARWHSHGDPSVSLCRQSPAGAPKAFLDAIPAQGAGCLTWPFATNGAGYAQINTAARGKRLVTRIVCERFHGPPPTPHHFAAHSCGKGHEACVAPWHLSWKTPAENSADREPHGTLRHGEAAAKKLTAADVADILALRGKEFQRVTAERFGISQTLVSRIYRGAAWKRVAEQLSRAARDREEPNKPSRRAA